MTAVSQISTARNLLCTAFDHYLTVCTSVNKSHAYGDLPHDSLLQLVDCVSDELSLARSLGKALVKAQAALASIRNRAPCIVPISRLPDDVLIHIFDLVATEKPCHTRYDNRKGGYAPQPLALTHVCSRWRQVANSSGHLWTHIDVPSYLSRSEVAIARTKDRISRAGRCPLDIHVAEPDIDMHSAPTAVSLGPFSELLSPISSQIRTLDVRLGKPLRSLQCAESGAKRYSPVLSSLLKHSTAGSLKRLCIRLENTMPGFTSQHYYIEGCENSEESHDTVRSRVAAGNVVSISMPEQELEALLCQVTVLDLTGIYPRWESKAYDGLVELRLGAYSGVSIPEAELRAILSSSPRLRHVDIGIKLTRRSTSYANNAPVLLEDLETLGTGQRSLDELGSLLRLIRPGSLPLSLSLDKSGRCSSHADIPRASFDTSIQEFFSRANVETLRIAGTYNYSQVMELLTLVPGARVLELSGLCLGNIKSNACVEFPNTGARLRRLYLVRGAKVAQHFVEWLAEAHQVGRVVVVGDSKIIQGDADSSSPDPDGRILADEASLSGYSFEYIPLGRSSPIELCT